MKQLMTLVLWASVLLLSRPTQGQSPSCYGDTKLAFWGTPGWVYDFPNITDAGFVQVSNDSAVITIESNHPVNGQLSATLKLYGKMSYQDAISQGYVLLSNDTNGSFYLVGNGSIVTWMPNGITYHLVDYLPHVIEVGDRNGNGILDIAGWPAFCIYGQNYGNFDFFVECQDWSTCVNEYVTVTDTICEGSTYEFAGQVLTDIGFYHDTLTNQAGCDSIVTLKLCQWINDTTYLNLLTCDPSEVGTFVQTLQGLSNGCDSVVITTTTLMPGGGNDTTTVQKFTCDIAQVDTTVVMLQTQSGCDSMVVTITQLSPTMGDTTYVQNETCHISELVDTVQTFASQHGCDSVVVLTTTLVGVDTTLLDSTTCDPAQVGTQVQVLSNQAGCDSLIITSFTLIAMDTTYIFDESCDSTAVGVTIQTLTSSGGCDSIVVTTISFALSDTTLLTDSTCDPASAGVFTQNLVTPQGCDSVVITTVSLLVSDTTLLVDSTCDPTAAGVFTQVLTNAAGCDSVVIETVTFVPADITLLFVEDCNPSAVGQDTVFLTNQSGCDSLVVTSTTLAAGPQLSATTASPLCFGQSNGSIDLTVEGAGPFIFYWDDPVNSGEEDQDSLATGAYSVTVIDAEGCEDSLEVQLEQPDSLSVHLTTANIRCNGDQNGLGDVLPSGGTAPYVIAWADGPSGTLQDWHLRDSLVAGSYVATVTDANGCSTTESFDIVEPEPLLISSVETTFVSCETGTGGSAAVSVSGGVPFYEFLWSDDQSGQLRENIAEGKYTVTVIDANGCEADTTVTILCDGCRMWSDGRWLYVKINTEDVNDNFELTITVSTIGGKKEKSFPLQVEAGIADGKFDLEDLATGMYLARATGQQIDKVVKFILN